MYKYIYYIHTCIHYITCIHFEWEPTTGGEWRSGHDLLIPLRPDSDSWMQTFQHRPPSWHWFPPNRHFAPGSVGYHYIYKLLGISWVTTLIPNLFSRSGGMTGLPCPWLRLIHSWCLPPKLETSSANRTSHVPGLSESLGAFCSATVHAAATDSSPREFGSRPTVCELEAMVHLVRWFTYSKWWCSSSQTATNNQRLRTRCLVSQASCISCISYIKLIISSYIRLYLIHSSTIFPWYSNRLVLPHHHQPLRLLSRAFQNSISSSGPLFSPSLAESSGVSAPMANGSEWLGGHRKISNGPFFYRENDLKIWENGGWVAIKLPFTGKIMMMGFWDSLFSDKPKPPISKASKMLQGLILDLAATDAVPHVK